MKVLVEMKIVKNLLFFLMILEAKVEFSKGDCENLDFKMALQTCVHSNQPLSTLVNDN